MPTATAEVPQLLSQPGRPGIALQTFVPRHGDREAGYLGRRLCDVEREELGVPASHTHRQPTYQIRVGPDPCRPRSVSAQIRVGDDVLRHGEVG
jgi:hypothetical protein